MEEGLCPVVGLNRPIIINKIIDKLTPDLEDTFKTDGTEQPKSVHTILLTENNDGKKNAYKKLE